MDKKTKERYDDIFCIPYKKEQYIIYMPLKNVVISGNASMVNLIDKANSGDEDAMDRLGISSDFFSNALTIEKKIRQPLEVDNLPAYAPTSVSLFLTNNCPLRCHYCYADGGESKLKMPWNMVTGVLDEILNNVLASGKKQMVVNFHGGGDVTSAWDLLVRSRSYLDTICTPHGIKANTSIGLSGILSNKQREWIVEHIDSATLSLDGDPENNRLRPMANGKASFPIVHETLQWFDKAGYNYGLRCTITQDSVDKMEQIVRFFCENYRVKRIKVEPMFPAGRAIARRKSVRSPSAISFVENYRKASKIAKDHGKELIYSGARIDTLSNVFCQAPGGSCAVTPDGMITSCYEVLSVDNPLASIFIYGRYNLSLRKIELNEDRLQGLSSLSVLNKTGCQDCFCKWHCSGDCPAKSIQAEEMPSDEYPDRCFINRELTKDQLLEALDYE